MAATLLTCSRAVRKHAIKLLLSIPRESVLLALQPVLDSFLQLAVQVCIAYASITCVECYL